MTLLLVLAIAFAVLLLFFAGVGIKVLVRRNGEFKRHCSGHDPYTGKQNGCACTNIKNKSCGQQEKHPYQPLDVNEELLKETR